MNRALFTFLLSLFVNGTFLFAQAPANDNLCDAVTITVGAACTELPNMDNTMATAEPNEPTVTCAQGTDTVSNSVWYSFVAPESPVHLLLTPEAGVPFQMNVFTLTGDCTDLSTLELVDCNTPSTNLLVAPSLVPTLTAGTTYFVQISGRRFAQESPTADEGRGCLTITEITPPANDDACNAIALELGAAAQIFSNLGATAQEGEETVAPPLAPDPFGINNSGWAGNTIEKSVWFTFSTPEEGANILIDLAGSEGLAGAFNSQITLYEVGDCADFSTYTVVSSADNGFGLFSLVVNPTTTAFCLDGGKTFYLLVDGEGSFFFEPINDEGFFSLQVGALSAEEITLSRVIAGPECEGGADGSIVVAGQGGAGDFTYEWNTGATTPAITDQLAAGSYTVTITDQCGVQLVESFEVPATRNGPIRATNSSTTICASGEVTLVPNLIGGIPAGTKNLYFQNQIDFGVYSLANTFINNPMEVDTIVADQTIRLSDMEFVGEQLYGVDFERQFFRVDATTGETTLIDTLDLGEGDFVSPADISFVPSQVKLYVTASTGNIYELDWATGETELVIATGIENIFAAAIDNSGILYGANFSETGLALFDVDIMTGIIANVETTGRTDLGFLNMEIDPSTDKLYSINSVGLRNNNFFFSFLEYSELDKSTFGAVQSFREVVDMKRPSAFAFKSAPAPTYQYDWSAIEGITDPSATTQTVMVDESSIYLLNVTDACGTTYEVALTVNLEEGINTVIDTLITLGPDVNYNGIAITGDTTLTESLLTSNGCDSLVTVNIATMTTSIRENWPQQAIQISPNPARDFLILETFNLNEKEVDIYVRDIYGRLLSKQQLMSQNMQIDLGNLEVGNYFLEIRGKEKIAVRRFVKM